MLLFNSTKLLGIALYSSTKDGTILSISFINNVEDIAVKVELTRQCLQITACLTIVSVTQADSEVLTLDRVTRGEEVTYIIKLIIA